jgi:hypothetical protein
LFYIAILMVVCNKMISDDVSITMCSDDVCIIMCYFCIVIVLSQSFCDNYRNLGLNLLKEHRKAKTKIILIVV